jgi:hypothetical protein
LPLTGRAANRWIAARMPVYAYEFADRTAPSYLEPTRFYNLPGMAERITNPDHPANVSRNDAQEFIAALNAREGH